MTVEVRPPSLEDRAAILNLGTYFLYDLLPFLDGDEARLNEDRESISKERASSSSPSFASWLHFRLPRW